MKQIFLTMASALLLFASCGHSPKTSANEPQTVAEETVEAEPVEAGEEDLPGEQYIDITLPGTDGKTISVSDYVANNRLTLIDFWASWCGPCRAEMPYVIKTYNDFHGRGLEIVGVSLDNDREAWINAIRGMQLMWPQMSDLKGWECAGAVAYEVQSIPANVLVDQQGHVVGRDLRGDELYNRVRDLLTD